MARYEIDGAIFTTGNAPASWPEATRWNGNNRISIATGSQWEHETLYRSAKGRYWIEHTSQWQGSTDYATLCPDREAALWLLANDHPLPADLAEHEAEVTE